MKILKIILLIAMSMMLWACDEDDGCVEKYLEVNSIQTKDRVGMDDSILIQFNVFYSGCDYYKKMRTEVQDTCLKIELIKCTFPEKICQTIAVYDTLYETISNLPIKSFDLIVNDSIYKRVEVVE